MAVGWRCTFPAHTAGAMRRCSIISWCTRRWCAPTRRTPGITVRPLREITGDTDFNEVFLDNVRVPGESVVGEVNKGWQVILTALGHERGTLLLVDHVRRQGDMARLRATIRNNGRVFDRTTRQQFAQFMIEVEIMKLHGFRS